MEKGLSKEKMNQLDLLIQNLSTTVKNSVLYSESHPVFEFSIKNLKASIEDWLGQEKDLELGISQDNILIGGKYLRESNALYAEVAEHFHSRGVIALYVSKGVEDKELTELFSFLKEDPRVIRKNGGINKNIKKLTHLRIKEIDYSELLASAREGVTEEEKDLWQSLASITEEMKKGVLPESKSEFLDQFLANDKKSSSALNKIYRDAVNKLEDEETSKNMQESIARMYEYFEKGVSEDEGKSKKDLTRIISRLEPDLLVRLFNPATIDGKTFNLAEKITKGFSDDFIADFVGSLISEEGEVNENLLKVFDKLVPDVGKANNVASMVTDKLMQEKLIDTDSLSELQISIKEIFSVHPDNKFMSQMYKLTVDTFLDRKTASAIRSGRLASLVEGYIRAAKEGGFKKEQIELILNIIWHENDPGEFMKYGKKLVELFPTLLDPLDVGIIKEAVELFGEKLRPKQERDKSIIQDSDRVLKELTSAKVVDKIISAIPGSSDEEVEDMAYILGYSDAASTRGLIDMFLVEEDKMRRSKYGMLLSKMGGGISDNIVMRIKDSTSTATADLFKILQRSDPEKAHSIAKELVKNRSAEVRAEALKDYSIESKEDENAIYELLKKEKKPNVQDLAAAVLLKTGKEQTIKNLFEYAQKPFSGQRFLLRVIEICGELRIAGSVSFLGKVVEMRSFFNKGATNKLRIASVVSLGRIRTSLALEFIEKGLEDENENVRNLCRLIVERPWTKKG